MDVTAPRLAETIADEVASLAPLDALRELQQAEAELEDLRRDLVARARDDGASWGDVGHALDVTRQSAHERFATAAVGPTTTTAAAPPKKPRGAFDLLQAGSVHVAADLLAGLPHPDQMPLPDDDRRIAEIAESLKTIERWSRAMRGRWRRHLRTLPAR